MAKYVWFHTKDYTEELRDTIERFKVDGYAWKNNPYSTLVLSTNSITVDAPELRLFSLGEVTIPYLKELKKKNVFKKYLIVRNDLSIDLVEYIRELEENGIVDLTNHIASIWYNIETNEAVKNILMEDLHWGFFGASGSGKGIAMRALVYQLAQFPESEYYIIDKDNDFMSIKTGKKVRFQQDYKDVTAYPQRFYNFMTYIRLYQLVRAQKYAVYGCRDWEQYNAKRREEIERNGHSDMELIPYATFILDEFQTFRNESLKLMKEEEFDRLINMILSVCRANGIRVIIGTQDTQKNIIGNSLSNVQTKCFFKLDSMSNSMGVPEDIFPNFRGPQMKKAYIFYLAGRGFVKFPFTDPGKLDGMIKAKLDELPDGYVEWKADTIMDLLLSVAKMTDSKILASYYEMFAQIGFGEEKVKRLEKNDDFLVLVAVVWAMFRYYQLGLLANKSLDFTVPIQESAFGKGDSAKIDAIIYEYISLLKSDKYALITKGIQNAILWKVCSDHSAQVAEDMDPDDDRKNFVAILSTIIKQYYDQQIHEADMTDIFTGTGDSGPSYFTRVSDNGGGLPPGMPDVEKIDQARRIIGLVGHFGPSKLQREMKMGYAQAMRLIDDMEELGYIRKKPGGPAGMYEPVDENDSSGELVGTTNEKTIPDESDKYVPDEFIPEDILPDEEEMPQWDSSFAERFVSERETSPVTVPKDDLKNECSEGEYAAVRIYTSSRSMITPAAIKDKFGFSMKTSSEVLERLEKDGVVGPADDMLQRDVIYEGGWYVSSNDSAPKSAPEKIADEKIPPTPPVPTKWAEVDGSKALGDIFANMWI